VGGLYRFVVGCRLSVPLAVVSINVCSYGVQVLPLVGGRELLWKSLLYSLINSRRQTTLYQEWSVDFLEFRSLS
jgi:hypothetical protein